MKKDKSSFLPIPLGAFGLQALKRLLDERRRNSLITPSELAALIEQSSAPGPSGARVKELIRELQRVGLLEMIYKGRQRLYKLHHERARDAKRHFDRIDKDRQNRRLSGLEEVHRRMGDRLIFTRIELNEAFSDLRLTAIDQMLSRLIKRGFLVKVAGTRGRARYQIVPLRWTLPEIQEKATPQRRASTPDRLAAALTFGGKVFCYATAMEIHRLCRYDVLSVVYLSGGRRFRRRIAKETEYVWIKRPEPELGITVHDHRGKPVLVSDIERTLIDMLYRPRYCLGEPDVLRAINLIEIVDAKKVVRYLEALGLVQLVAKVGLFLDHNRDRWNISKGILTELHNKIPKKPVYLFPGTPSKLVAKWQVRLPIELTANFMEDVNDSNLKRAD